MRCTKFNNTGEISILLTLHQCAKLISRRKYYSELGWFHMTFETQHGIEAIINSTVELPFHEILHHLRGVLEQNHRLAIYSQHYTSFRNKIVLICVFKGSIGGLWEPVLHNYLYRRWFQPYLSDIDMANTLLCHVLDIHSMINNRLDSIKVETPPFYTTRPIFRAFFVAIPGQDWGGCTTLEYIASLKVLIVLTGETKGLSGPIFFASIADKSEIRTLNGLEAVETDLETAVDFTMDLEHREEAVFGLHPIQLLPREVCIPLLRNRCMSRCRNWLRDSDGRVKDCWTEFAVGRYEHIHSLDWVWGVG
ncbi:Uncharacterized protein HZ326_22766 [Fusarium oxysporum f. sp. albedinis]|nr:Uncharacterized protein HZ326_22766 [Fusarium oxysporum f. sp. albedinis]